MKKKKKNEGVQMLKIEEMFHLRKLQDVWCFPNGEFIWVNDFVAVEFSSVLCSKHLWMGRE